MLDNLYFSVYHMNHDYVILIALLCVFRNFSVSFDHRTHMGLQGWNI